MSKDIPPKHITFEDREKPDEKLLEFCKTAQQFEAIEAWLEVGNKKGAANKMGLHISTFKSRLRGVLASAAKAGWLSGHDNTHLAPPGYSVKGTSTLLDEFGNTRIQWVKTDKDREAQAEIFQEFVETLSDQIKTYKPFKRVKSPTKTKTDLLAVYPMGDPHIGMYAWAEETGADFDCDVAEANLRNALCHLIDLMEPAETAIILNLGDFFHSDNQSNRTARAGNALDVDTRWARVLDIGITLMIDIVMEALKKHKKVLVKNNIGNHDDHSSQMLSLCMKHAFRDNPRVEIIEPMKAFFAYQFGNVSIFSSHGHMVKPNKMQGVISNYYPEMWGQTEHRYAHLGHFHHEEKHEDNGLVTEIHNTLAATDAWHHASGYKAKRNMKAIEYHKEYGEIARFTYNLNR